MTQFTNQAQLSYNNSVKNSNIAVGELQEVMSVSKIAVSADYTADSRITYAVSMVNCGSFALTGMVLTDTLGAYPCADETLVPLDYVTGTIRYYVNGLLQAAPTAALNVQNQLQITNVSIPADSTAMFLYEANVNQYAPLEVGSCIDNEVTIQGGTLAAALTATATVPVNEEPNLSITKSISPVPVAENGTLTYTFVIQNTGNTAAAVGDHAAITDTFNPILSGLTVTFNGTTWTEGVEYTYDAKTGLFTSEPGMITVQAASCSQDIATKAWVTTPGVSTLVVSGTV